MSGGHLEGVWIVYKGCLGRLCVSVCLEGVWGGVGCIEGYEDL